MYKSTDQYCSRQCKEDHKGPTEVKPRTRIKPVSDKRIIEDLQYKADRIIFLGKPENRLCVIKGPTCTKIATTVEHRRGRKGFADEQKRLAGISLYLDQDYWLAACGCCNTELENNPELSRQHQLSKIHGGKKTK